MTLEIAGLSKRFEGPGGMRHAALSGIDLAIRQHECVAIRQHECVSLVGTSGCGKSTLLRIISGLERPTAGQERLGQRPVTGPTSDLAMLFQEPRLMPCPSGWRLMTRS
jgi:ABC-type nitrate/sulfonate/bicarbonate transport system ATPase subunit